MRYDQRRFAPPAPARQPFTRPWKADSDQPGPRPKLLIVDDDLGVAEILRRVCQASGFIVSVAYDLQLGKRLLEPSHSIVIVDVCLGEDSGIDLIREAAAMPEPPGIIAISGSGPAVLAEASAAGADQVLEKPFSMRLLTATLERLSSDAPAADVA